MLFHLFLYICIMKTGIYQIKSIRTGRLYVGSAVNITYRWTRHKRDLFKNKHHSRFLQRHYNKYGLEDLIFSILEECVIEDLLVREQFYLDTLSCHFNNAKIAGSCLGSVRSPEQRAKMSEYTKGENNPTYGLERTPEWRGNISKANKGQKAWNKNKTGIYTEDVLKKMSISASNKERLVCENCNQKVTPHNYSRWHGSKCDYLGVPEGHKKCASCKNVKLIVKFSKNKNQLDGLERRCKACRKKSE